MNDTDIQEICKLADEAASLRRQIAMLDRDMQTCEQMQMWVYASDRFGGINRLCDVPDSMRSELSSIMRDKRDSLIRKLDNMLYRGK